MIVTIDGPAGSGKSTAARKLAAALEWPYLDTGAMYRAIALKVLETDTSTADPDAVIKVAREVTIELDCGPTHARVIMDGKDVSEAIRTMRVSEITSPIARIPEVRAILVDKQRLIGKQLGTLVTEGRDQGTTVFPDADVKFLVEADDAARAERRYHEMVADGQDVKLEEVLGNIRRRDSHDQTEWAPLIESGQAIRIDTTQMNISQVLDFMKAEIEKKRTGQ